MSEPVKHRSVSQVLQLERCGEAYRLQRLERAWEKPAAWFPQGTAVHKTVEEIEKSDRSLTLVEAEEVYKESYSQEVNRYAEKTPNLGMWFASGPYGGEADIERRWGKGLEQVGKYMTYIENHPKPDVLDGRLAVELEFTVNFGDVEVRGFMDQSVKKKPVDVKSGNKPGDVFQLETYAGVMQKLYGIKPTSGFFWMGKTGKMTFPYDVSHVSEEYLADRYGAADLQIREERFDPDPEPSKCRFCTVALACKFSAA